MGRILGIDFGEKRLGLALSDESHTLASPLAVYERTDCERDLQFLRDLVAQYRITEIVLGLPVNMDGSLGPKAEQALEFKRLLEEHLKLPVSTFDERLTTVEAERVLLQANLSRKKRKAKRDTLAAVLILQGYLLTKSSSVQDQAGIT
ncbi:MAG: Holliday junction resolvase RuvX [Candidatus Bipolaricaulota bacterium]|nr:Holliday junction resolvase RuvX [Candidatus Bipolaricaulota bacterium]MDW8031839.1 Holliday junction resolvase RuvX [Candidatus Bipolaricaulota bacterium]